MREIAMWVGAALAASILFITYTYRDAIAASAGVMLQVAVVWLLAVLSVVLAIAIWVFVSRERDRYRRPRDGSFPLMEYRVPGRKGTKILINPNNIISPAAVLDPEHGFVELEPRAGWDRQAYVRAAVQITHNLQAIAPGDEYLRYLPNYHPPRVPNRAVQPPRPVVQDGQVVDDGLPALPPPPDPERLLEMSEPNRWAMGVSGDGEVAEFRPRSHAHAAIVGATGTGKTASAGFLMAAHALRSGHHLVVLDPEGGVDWAPWAGHGEIIETDYTVFPEQMQELERMVQGPDPRRPPLTVIVEEFGDLLGRLKSSSRQEWQRTVAMLETIMRRGRKAGVHLVLMDQAPTNWPGQVVANARWVSAFRLGPHRGAALQIYGAEDLPERGVFMHDGERYVAPHVAPVLERLLGALPRSKLHLFGRSRRRSAPNGLENGADTPLSPGANERLGWRPTGIQARVWAWLDEHPGATQADLRRHFDISKAYAHELWHRWRADREIPPSVEAVDGALVGEDGVIDISTREGRKRLEDVDWTQWG